MRSEIRSYTADDLDECLRIITENYDTDARLALERELTESLTSQNPHALKFITLWEAGKIRGFASLSASRMQNEFFELCWVNIDPAHQNRGLGSHLIKAIINLCAAMRPKAIMLFADRAHTLYRRLGFRELSRYGDDRFMMLDFS